MKTLHNIFTSKKSKLKKEPQKEKISVDYREKTSLVASELVKLGFEIEFKELKVADYIVKDVAIERKTVSDFISSMINRRLINQIEELKQYENKLLIIEGIDEQELYSDENSDGVSPNSIRGFLLSILLRHKIPTLFTKNPKDTAKFMERIARKKENEMSIRAVKKSLDKKEQMQFIVEGFPGIGPKNARKLLEKFKTIQRIINASQEELQNTIGKKSEIFNLGKENYY